MSAQARELIATINGRQVGLLREQANLWTFEYSQEWLENPQGFDLSPHLSRAAGTIVDGGTHRPVQWFFDNLLPEEHAREVLAREAAIQSSDAFGLLAYYGKESAGAITLRAQGEQEGESGLIALSDEELHDRISQLPKRSLTAGAPKRMSNAGAQHKLAICVRDGQLYFPVGHTASTHILKPDHVDKENWPSSVANEYFVMRLAKALELSVPAVAIRYVPDPVYLVERFDRVAVGGEVQRLHVVDACQLLNLDRTFKYQQATAQTLVRCIEMCQYPASARRDLLAWVLFNLLAGNGDAHLKNLSFYVSAEGITLAPFYDLVSTEAYRAEVGNDPRWPNTPLSTRIGAAATFADVTADAFFTFAGELGATRTAAARLITQFTNRIETTAERLYEEFAATNAPLAATRAGELRVLRAIRRIVLREMTPRFAIR